MNVKALRALRWQFAVGAIVVWNVLNLFAVKLNGGWRAYREPSALFLLALTCVLFAAASCALVYSERARQIAVAPSRRELFAAEPFIFIALLCAGLAVVSFYFGLRYAGGGGA